ncbi:flagellar protein FlaG [Alteromonas sp. Cnat3-28]|uniref:flagellar protein FlaG n=1 Tax=Alteromonas sp. Cnat3-28 TaxID=2917729 RepID=UPI001EF5C0DA|nr:flagellar protein FlaG [Alteromonas sp. Cnat3-28]
MKIQNMQGGQVFASPSMGRGVEPQIRVKSETGVISQELDSENKSKNTNANELIASNDQFSTQVSRIIADNESSEAKITLDEATKKVESFLKTQNRDLAFSIDEETNRSVVIVKDAQSDEVIRQIPSEDVLELAERIKDLQNDIGQTVGMFIDQQV